MHGRSGLTDLPRTVYSGVADSARAHCAGHAVLGVRWWELSSRVLSCHSLNYKYQQADIH